MPSSVGFPMAYSQRNDEQGDASFDRFLEAEPLAPSVELEGAYSQLAHQSSRYRNVFRLVFLGSMVIFLIASFGLFSMPSSISNLGSWSSSTDDLAGLEPCGMCASAPEVCAKYGRSAVGLSRAYTGSGTRLQRVLAKAARGEKITLGVLGGSVSEGIDVPHLGRWHEVVQGWFNATYPDTEVELVNGAVPGRGSEYFMSCHGEHIDKTADLVMIELGVNDWHTGHPYDDTIETLVRAVLNYPSQPAIIFAESFSLTLPALQAGADAHLGVAQYYNLPVISLRNWLLPELLRDPSRKDDYFFGNRDGTGEHNDYLHIGIDVHRAFGDLVGALLSQQKCKLQLRERKDDRLLRWDVPQLDGVSPTAADMGRPGTSIWPVSDTGNDMEIPRLRISDSWSDTQREPVTETFCLSLNSKRPESQLTFNETASHGWRKWDDDVPWRNVKSYLRADNVDDKVVFSDLDLTAGTWTLYYLRSNKKGLGNLICWVDDMRDRAIKVEGYWERKMDVGEVLQMQSDLPKGKHDITCTIDGGTTADPGGGHTFLIIAVMY